MDETKALSESSTVLPSAWIERLFVRLAAIYGNKFGDMWAGQDVAGVREMWASEMRGLSVDEIRKGLERIRSKHPSWPPSLYEFMELCRPSVIDHESALHEAIRGMYARRDGKMGEWSHRAIYWAGVDVTPFDLFNLTWPQIKGRWIKALDSRMADANLPAIPEAPKQLVAPETPAEKNIERLHAMLAGLTGKKKDYRGWVKKILDRKAAGDKTLADVAYAMALKSVNIK